MHHVLSQGSSAFMLKIVASFSRSSFNYYRANCAPIMDLNIFSFAYTKGGRIHLIEHTSHTLEIQQYQLSLNIKYGKKYSSALKKLITKAFYSESLKPMWIYKLHEFRCAFQGESVRTLNFIPKRKGVFFLHLLYPTITRRVMSTKKKHVE